MLICCNMSPGQSQERNPRDCEFVKLVEIVMGGLAGARLFFCSSKDSLLSGKKQEHKD